MDGKLTRLLPLRLPSGRGSPQLLTIDVSHASVGTSHLVPWGHFAIGFTKVRGPATLGAIMFGSAGLPSSITVLHVGQSHPPDTCMVFLSCLNGSNRECFRWVLL